MAAQQKFRFCLTVQKHFVCFSDYVLAFEMTSTSLKRLFTGSGYNSEGSFVPSHTKSTQSCKFLKTAFGSRVTYSRRQTVLQGTWNNTALEDFTCTSSDRCGRMFNITGAAAPLVQSSRIHPGLNVASPDGNHHRILGVRFYSWRSKDRGDDQHEKLRGAVVYLPNPLTWLQTKWNLFIMRRKWDPNFSEEEFLNGAAHAISHVTQMVSAGSFCQLRGLVTDELIEWFKHYSTSLTEAERGALVLQEKDMVLIKVRYISLDDSRGKALAYVDSVCFGLKIQNNIPFLVDLGLRFRRDYATEPPGFWELVGVTHIRIQNLEGDP